MKYRKVLAAALSLTIISGVCSCGKNNSSSEKTPEIVGNTKIASNEEKNTTEDFDAVGDKKPIIQLKRQQQFLQNQAIQKLHQLLLKALSPEETLQLLHLKKHPQLLPLILPVQEEIISNLPEETHLSVQQGTLHQE